jgi:four helix bundle protein
MKEGASDENAPRYRQLKAWQVSDDLAVDVHKLTRGLPKDEYSLKDQIVRAAVSAPANIAEGYGRGSNREFAQSLIVAHGSLYEVDYLLHFLNRVELIERAACDELTTTCRLACRLTYGLIRTARADATSAGTKQRYLREDPVAYGFEFE